MFSIIQNNRISAYDCNILRKLQGIYKLKRIFSYFRATVDQQRLCDVAVLRIELEETEETDIENIIDLFAARKVSL